MRLGTESSRGSDAQRDQEVSAQQPRSSQQQHVLDISRRQGARQDGVPTLEGWDICSTQGLHMEKWIKMSAKLISYRDAMRAPSVLLA